MSLVCAVLQNESFSSVGWGKPEWGSATMKKKEKKITTFRHDEINMMLLL